MFDFDIDFDAIIDEINIDAIIRSLSIYYGVLKYAEEYAYLLEAHLFDAYYESINRMTSDRLFMILAEYFGVIKYAEEYGKDFVTTAFKKNLDNLFTPCVVQPKNSNYDVKYCDKDGKFILLDYIKDKELKMEESFYG